MTLLDTSSPSRAFATPHAGEDYFATEAHYLSLAGRLVAALRRGSVFILLTGDPPPDPLLLSRALETAAAWWYAVIVIARDSEINRDQLLRDPLPLDARDDNDWRRQGAGPPQPLPPLFVIDAADGLSDEQIENVYETLVHCEGTSPAAVLLARQPLLARLERSNSRLIEGELTACLRLQELGRDEIGTFIRRQRCPSDQLNAFTAEATAAIADISRGDPALVNHLARLTLEFAALVGSKGEEQTFDVVDEARASVASLEERRPTAEATTGRLQDPRLRRRPLAWRLKTGLLLVLAIGGLLVVPGHGLSSLGHRAEQSLAAVRSVDFGAWIKLGPDKASPARADDASHMALATLPTDRSIDPQTEPVLVAPIPEQPAGEAAYATSTNQAASLPPMPPAIAPAAPATTTAQSPEPLPTPPNLSASPAETRPSTEEIAALVARGDAYLAAGDISSARLFYERAVAAGDGRAALRTGATFDPAFLDQAGIRNTFGDPRQALSWYRRARDLGAAEAARRLNDLKRPAIVTARTNGTTTPPSPIPIRDGGAEGSKNLSE